jgi:predicted butyrate kinase (DUF1464 family)
MNGIMRYKTAGKIDRNESDKIQTIILALLSEEDDERIN